MSNHNTTRAANAGTLSTYLGYEVRGLMPIAPRKKLSRNCDWRGRRFGRLLIEKDLGVHKQGNRAWGCLCDCGLRVCVASRNLREGRTRSCGCITSDISGGRNKLPFGHAARNELLGSYKKSAASRGYAFELSPESFFALVSADCAYCGSPPNLFRKPNSQVNGGFMYTGVDRVENDKGYIEGNVVSCCWVCNRAKGQMTTAEFMTWVDRITTFRLLGSAL